MSRVPTEKQYRLLLVLGNGCALVIGYKREIEPLLWRGWVTATPKETYYTMVRITPYGLRALALAVEKYGLPEFAAKKVAA